MDEREQDQSEKTEDPTDERRRQFREEGKLPATREILGAFSLILLTSLLYFYGAGFVSNMSNLFQSSWRTIPHLTRSDRDIGFMIIQVLLPILPALAIGMSILILLPAIIGLLLGRFNWSWKKLEFNLTKLDPIKGIGNIFGKTIGFETFKSVLKSLLILSVLYFFIRSEIPKLSSYLHMDMLSGFILTGKSLLLLLIFICMATFLIGIADYVWNIFQIEKELRMTKQQLKQEIKQQEGDPLMKGRRRSFGRELVFGSSIQRVPESTFVVTNPTHYSVAVRYADGMGAPIVVSKGQDYLALRIRQVAKENDIIVIENKALARALYKTVEIGDAIPSSLYLAVIEVLKAVFRIRGRDYFERYGLAKQFG